jgi:spore coat protein U-like protein
MRKLIIGVGAAATVAALATAAYAGTATGTLNVTLTITATCTVRNTPTLAFGSVGLLTSNTDAQTDIAVQCTNTTPYDIALGQGANGSSVTTRQMLGTGGSPSSVNYSLYRDASRTQNWGETIGTDVVHAIGNGLDQNTTVYGRVPTQTSVKPDTYTDTVAITVTY